MKRTITSVAAVAILTVAFSGQLWAFGDLKVSSTVNNNRDYSNRVGGNSKQNSNNTTNRNDNRDYTNRSTNTDSRDYSNKSTNVDSRNLSDHSSRDNSNRSTNIDSRNLSDNRTTIDSHNDNRMTVNNQRHQSHDVGGAFFNKDVNVRAGSDTVTFGPITGGTGNVMDASVNGNMFQIGSSGK